ncbi:MAG: pilus assembly protein PilP [Desulfuromonadales bacterium]|nr:pilus assembly protein PilP [Desulfuromonadales bacterium]
MRLFLIVTVALLMIPSTMIMAQTNGEVEVAAEGVTAGEFTYNPGGRRDPFTPLIRRDDPPPAIQTTRRPEALRGPLERYELRQLRLIAVMVVRGNPRAMVAAPDGKSYTVKVDDYIGINGGKVKDIQTRVMGVDEQGLRVEKNPDRIVVEEVGVDSLSGNTIKEERYIVL